MSESRQQRRARERRELKASIAARVQTRVEQARTVQAMWRAYYEETLKPRGLVEGDPAIDDGLVLMRKTFYAGVAAMLELMMRVSPDDVSEDQGVEMLQRLYDELQTYAQGLR